MSLIRSAVIATLLAGVIAAPAAFAQGAPNANAGSPNGRAKAAFDRMDTNKDGYIDRAEMRQARAVTFDRLDKNKDGQLTPDEMRGGRGASNQRAGDTRKTMTRDEFISRADDNLTRRDTDRDGRLSFAEFTQRPTRPARATR